MTTKAWGSLNPSLTAFRNAINRRLPDRSTTSDGGVADENHSSDSQHQLDENGWSNAFDCDNNFLRSGTPAGTPDERKILEAIKLDFERDPHGRSHLWISHREISQHDEGWDEDYYGGSNPHDEHTHLEARKDRKDDGRDWPMPQLDALLEDMMALDYEETKKASGQGWAAYPVTDDATAALMAHRTYRAAMLDTTDTGALRKRLDAQDAAIAAVAAQLDQVLLLLAPPLTE